MKKIIPDKIPKKYLKLEEAIFHHKVHVLLNYSPEDYVKWLNKVGAKDLHETKFNNLIGFSTVIEQEDKPDEFIIFLPEFNWTIVNQGTLIHEIVHTIIKIWESNNIPYNDQTQEFLAHSIGNLYESIAYKLLEIKK